MINLELAQRQNLSEDEVFKIEQLHYSRRLLHDAIAQAISAGNKTVARAIAKALPEIELELQKLWKFKQDIGYYKFWLVPGCSCCKLDSDDNFPYGPYYINNGCNIHGTT
jgi:hypothetical protein